MTLSELNKNKWIKLFGNGLLIIIIILIFSIFFLLNFYSNTYEVTETYKRISMDIQSPYIQGGMILTIGLFAMLVLKLIKYNATMLVFGILTLIGYYIKMLWIGI